MVEGDIRIHMHLVSPITTHMPLMPMTLRDVLSCNDTEQHDEGCTDTFPLPPGASKLTRVTRYWHFTVTDSLCRQFAAVFSARCNIYISRLCCDAIVRLSVHLSVTEVHWRIIANLGFKFRSYFTAHCGRRAAGGCRAACGQIISRHAIQC